jgi:molybdenum cofactor guanylyltransferase
MNLTAIILAGGQSLRMGTDKALVPYHGKPLIQYSIDLALGFTKNILIITNREELLTLGFPLVADIYPIKAPLAGIHAGLKTSKTDWNLVLTCDMPNVPAHLIKMMISTLEPDTELVLPGHDDYIEPLCGFYNKSLVPVIESNIRIDKFSPLDLLKVSSHKIVQIVGSIDEQTDSVFKNVNSEYDLLS